jgi:hypothetical protein
MPRVNGATTLSITTLSIMTIGITIRNGTFSIMDHHTFMLSAVVMLSVANKPIILSVVMLNVVMLSVMAPSVAITCYVQS